MWRRSAGSSTSSGKSAAEPPQVGPCGVPPAVSPAFGLEPLQINHHLERAAIVLAQIHHRRCRIFSTTDAAGQMRDITHLAINLSKTARGSTLKYFVSVFAI